MTLAELVKEIQGPEGTDIQFMGVYIQVTESIYQDIHGNRIPTTAVLHLGPHITITLTDFGESQWSAEVTK